MGESTDTRATARFDRRVRLEFHGATIISDAGLVACRDLDTDVTSLVSTPKTACGSVRTLATTGTKKLSQIGLV